MSTSTQFDDAAVAELAETIDHFNANHADTVLLIARYAAGARSATDAEVVAVDADGADLLVRSDGADRAGRIERLAFPEPAADLAGVYAQVYAAVGRARATVGEAEPITSLERELTVTRSLPTFVTEVESVREIAHDLREIVVAGGLDGFRSLGADQFVFLMLPTDEAPIDEAYSMEVWRTTEPRPPGAYYTVRSFDPDAGRMVLWAVTHGHDGGVGGWAATCAPGDRIGLWGPREGMGVPRDARSLLMFADASGVAAVAVILDELPATIPVRVLIEVGRADEVVELPAHANSSVVWLFRGADEPGTGTRLFDAVRAEPIVADGLVVFGAGESKQMTQIRKYLRHDVGLAASAVYVTGYWRRARRPA